MTETHKGGDKAPHTYAFAEIEAKWQTYWDKNETFKTDDIGSKPKFYILDMFPYPSGNGLHVGHAEGYTATDIYARFKRMQGFNVMHPMGWDAFGLPAEQYAIKNKIHPKISTQNNINNFRKQIKSLGYSTDWSREIDTTEPSYYRWTQWIFLKLYEKGLAYESNEPVNWCPALGTVLANEEVVDGVSEVGGHPVEKKSLRQWVLKITEYAERLLNDLDEVDWPESTKAMQRNWIGKSIGAQIDFKVKDHNLNFRVFTTRPDTIFGTTFCVLAPEHPLVEKICSASQQKMVLEYCEKAKQKSTLDRTSLSKDKTGIFTGAYAINPVNDQMLPIYVADYVLFNYGKGAVMGVPAHDERDHEFAKSRNIPILEVVKSAKEWDCQEKAFCDDGMLKNSDFLNDLSVDEAKESICLWLEKNGLGEKSVTYRLRDWIFSRQRYWGEPFPLLHASDGSVTALKESELPLTLPELNDYEPSKDGDPPLAKAKEWVNINKDGKNYQRETNIMPQWAGSCWYYLRYLDPHNAEQAWKPELANHWLPVDLYVGGVEHANLHLLYARFWHKVLYDLGLVNCKEPFKKLRHQGLILGPNSEKMSKSRGNVINPDDVIREWGADSLRIYEMFMGPIEAVKPWQSNGIIGVHRFLKRLWSLCIDSDGNLKLSEAKLTNNLRSELHKLIKKVSLDTEDWKFNTAIAAFMEFLNLISKEEQVPKEIASALILLLAPYAPHLSEELWQRLGNKNSLSYEAWPKYDESFILEDKIILSIMVNGKFRSTIEIQKNISEQEIIAMGKENVARYLQDKTLLKQVYVPFKVINFVVKD